MIRRNQNLSNAKPDTFDITTATTIELGDKIISIIEPYVRLKQEIPTILSEKLVKFFELYRAKAANESRSQVAESF